MKYVLITGAAGGMGNKTAMYLAAQGFCVFAMDRVAVAAQKNIIPLQCDITDEACVQAAVQAVKKETDVLYAILHFAGIYTLDSFVEIETERFQHILQVNLLGAFLVNKFFMPLLHRGSRIIITTSELAPLAPLPFTGIYAVSKTALDRYAYALQMELQLLGISVSVIRAGADVHNQPKIHTENPAEDSHIPSVHLTIVPLFNIMKIKMNNSMWIR